MAEENIRRRQRGATRAALPRGAVGSPRNTVTHRYGFSPAIFIVPSLFCLGCG
jgi:hypothetical protein